MMRSLLLGVLCGCLAFSGIGAALGEELAAGSARGAGLAVGTVTPPDGHFGTDFFGDNTSDMDARLLLHGYAIVDRDKTPGTAPHGVSVSNLTQQDGTDKSRTYTVTFADGLKYNDGTSITARDYAFSLLLAASPELVAVGGTADPLDHIQGFETFHSGSSKTLAGVRLLAENQLSIQIKPEFTQYFYELTLLSTVPYPISVIAPGCEVADDGQGVYLKAASDASSITADGFEAGVFSAEMLQKTLLDPQTGYEFAPKVTSGPYQLSSFNATSKEALFSINRAFKGASDGQIPSIEKITLRPVTNENMFTELEADKVQLVNKIASRDALVKGQEVSTNNPNLTGTPYLRSGLTFLSFACEQGPTASEDVRMAITMALDKDALTTEMMGSAAIRVYGYYGVGQWMAAYTGFSSEGTVLESLARLDVPKNIDKANELLDAAGWTFDAQGNAWASGVRHRKNGEAYEPLTIHLAKPLENKSSAIVERALEEGLSFIGAELEVTELPFQEMLQHYYRLTDRKYDMFFLATNFGYVFDPYYDFNTGEAYQGSINKTGLRDEKLMELAKQMRMTSPNDLDGYMSAWVAFQERFVEQMPLIPLYSGIYMDVASTALKGYDILKHSSWAQAILYTTM